MRRDRFRTRPVDTAAARVRPAAGRDRAGRSRLTRPLAAVVAAAALLAGALPGAASAAAPTDAAQWDLNSARPSVNVAYAFENLVNRSHVRYGERTFGINLVWGSYSAQWTFKPKAPPNVRDHRRRAMQLGEPVAIYNSVTRQYLVYGERTWGINLVWSRTPHYEWSVERDADGDVGLYNSDARDHLVYGRRGTGINLRWLKDVRRGAAQNAPGSLHDASVLLTAQPVIQGYVPFLGRYGGGVNFNAVLTKVANPPGGAPLHFVKPGWSTEQCGNANATTYLAPGATMTADQLRTLYGSTQPSLRNGITFLACAATELRSTFLNIQWRQL